MLSARRNARREVEGHAVPCRIAVTSCNERSVIYDVSVKFVEVASDFFAQPALISRRCTVVPSGRPCSDQYQYRLPLNAVSRKSLPTVRHDDGTCVACVNSHRRNMVLLLWLLSSVVGLSRHC